MFLRKSFDKRTGIYRSKDPIDNFRFRITLKTVHSFVKIPKFDAEKLSDAEDLDKVEYYDFTWQQKAFNSREIEYFSKLENCKTDIEKTYHERIVNEKAQNETETNDENISSRIFSYVSDDKYTPKDDDEAIFQINWWKLAKFVESASETEETPVVEDPNGLIKEPLNHEEALKLHFKDLGPFESMYILANLERELQLFTIKYRPSDGLLLVYPDFNNIDVSPYLKEINLDSRHFYQYSVENLSNDSQNEDWLLKTDIDAIANKLYDLSLKTPLLFNLPPHYCTNICLCMEIQSAQDFEYDNIHVKYEIILPNKCTLVNGNLIGSTHSSSRSLIDNNVWLIGHCHEINILCTPNYQFDDPLKIAYEVVSIDSWTRERTEGYAITSFPFNAGRELDKIQCYRDLDDSWKSWLERYFIGGRRKVLLHEFNGLQNTIGEESHKLNRYGNRTITTGTIKIIKNTVIQRNFERNSKTKVTNRQKHSRQTMISNVLSAYQEAREQLEAISEN